MYAVIAAGGKQYRVAQGDVIRVERLDGESGAHVDFDKVLLISDGEKLAVGAPYLEGGKVSGTIKSQGRARKIEIIKFRRRKGYRRKQGHRQAYTEIQITDIIG
jgi:large subunit ribosomal protein L21